MEMLKDKTLFNREHINDIVIKYDSKLDSLYTSKIWEKILNLRSWLLKCNPIFFHIEMKENDLR